MRNRENSPGRGNSYRTPIHEPSCEELNIAHEDFEQTVRRVHPQEIIDAR
ncbi:MAG TPA: hypothetical protein VFN35_15910 [Ktedonobacteraceae bacterium]|nr:hypothetical protein [Ktedonobacteraceae bacterium]